MFYMRLFRKKSELAEAIKVKEAEAETYISEIEVSFMTPLIFCTAVGDGFALTLFSYNTIKYLC